MQFFLKVIFTFFILTSLSVLGVNQALAQFATSRDWIGVYPKNAPDSPAPQIWFYVNCTQSPTTPFDKGQCDFTMPVQQGIYELRLFANDTYTKLQSSTIYIGPAGQAGACQLNNRASGLISTTGQSATSKFGNDTANCVIDPKAAFVPFKIPSYDELKSIYYTQSKVTNKVSIAANANIPASYTQDGLYLSVGAVNVTGTKTGNGVQVFFIEGDLNINSNILYHTNDSNGSFIFIVKGNINIAPSVTQIDAILMSEGIICTSVPTTGLCTGFTDPATTQRLVVNGSLISLNKADTTAIRFRRTLSDNNQAAELINHQPKNLIIIKNLFSTTLSINSEQ